MSDIAWILESDKGVAFGSNGVAGSFILPQGDMHIEPHSIAGKRIWVLLRGHEDRLLMVVKVKKIERIIDGYHKGDYIIGSDLTQSIRLVSGYAEATKYKNELTHGLRKGLQVIESSISDNFCKRIAATIQVKLTAPDQKALSNINLQMLPGSHRMVARNAIRTIVSRLTLDKLWASGTGDKLSPYANFAHALFANTFKGHELAELIRELKTIDPIVSLLDHKALDIRSAEGKKEESPKVDLEFTEIEPEKIYAREFLSIDSKLKDLEEALNKTEHAEKMHQEMLKDVVVFLISKGIVPYESCSIDLMYNLGDKLNVFEIKSTTSTNILAQSAKGAFQLACYLNELAKDYKGLSSHLILRRTENHDIELYVTEVLKRLGVPVLFYDPNKSWPARIEGLPS